MLQYWLHCSYFISFPSVHTSLFMFSLISFSPHFIDHVSFFISFSPQSISFISSTIVQLIYIYLIWLHSWSFSLIVRFTFQPIPFLEINNLRLSLDKYLILNRYSLLEAELRGFTTPCLFILSKKYKRQFNFTSEWDLILQLTILRVKVGLKFLMTKSFFSGVLSWNNLLTESWKNVT